MKWTLIVLVVHFATASSPTLVAVPDFPDVKTCVAAGDSAVNLLTDPVLRVRTACVRVQ